MKKQIVIFSAVFFVCGFIWGKYQNQIIKSILTLNKSSVPVNIFDKLGSNYYINFTNFEEIATDTLLKKDKTILFFWSPQCQYCKDLYSKIEIDTSKIGEIWIPQTNDFEYLEFFIAKNKLDKIQLVKDNIRPVDTFKINKIPELWIVNKSGKIIYHQTGSNLKPEFYELIKQ